MKIITMTVRTALVKCWSWFRKPDITRGDVVIPLEPENKIYILANELPEFIDNCIRNGVQLDNNIERFCDMEGIHGSCDMNGDVCINPKCRVCAKSTLRSLIRRGIEQDLKTSVADYVMGNKKDKP